LYHQEVKGKMQRRGGYLEALLNGCPDAILAIDAEGTIKFANKVACDLTERNMTELIGESIVEVYENRETAREANRRIYEAGGTIHEMESRVRTKKGKIIPVRISASHLYDSAGKYTGAVGYFCQYRPWAGAEAEIKARAEALESSLDIWRALAAPVFELYPGLSVMMMVGHLDADRFEEITSSLLEHIEKVKTRVVLIDLFSVPVEDLEVARRLVRMIRTVRLLGAECIVADMHPTLAQAMEPLLAELGSLKSFSGMDIALEHALNTIGYEVRQKA
jgi:PAS domain S-box-containing protein